ncbi:protein RGF1 INDUCIBLE TRANSCRIPTION FACTOR 1-like [Apium graveolens]|uniref:protein RGF1 INDUCIBLE TRANSCRIPTION FACTOR 1-like n=1 Tax=Apium graveolens TaxID=4045 RepID=UPI003D7ABFC6
MGLGGDSLLTSDEDKYKKSPPWLKPLLHQTFYAQCAHHHHVKNECNMFCLDCFDAPLCSLCLSAHQHHRTIQIRKSSYHDVVRVPEIQTYVDLTGVQTYVINNAKVVFLNQRPQARHGSKAVLLNKRPQVRLPKAHVIAACQVCQRSLLDSFCFCSLGCKTKHGSIARESEGQNRVLQGLNLSTTSPVAKIAKRRRKGIPQRAPTGGLLYS